MDDEVYFNVPSNQKKRINDKVKNDWAINGQKSIPKATSETVKKADVYINPKIDMKATHTAKMWI